MPTVNPSAFGPKPAWFDAAGNPAVSYKLFMYAAGSTSTKQNSYTNSTGAVANTNPIILNALGQTPNELWWDNTLLYKVVLAPSTDTDPPTNPVWTVDNLAGMNSNNGGQSVAEWILYSGGPTYVSTNSFTVAGNQTQTFHTGRRLQLTTVGGMVYGRITSSVFASQTTVTVQMDGTQILDSSLSAVYYSILTNDVLALPERIASTTGTNIYSATVGIARLVIGDEYKLNFVIQNNGALSPTLALDGNAPLSIFTQNGLIPSAGMLSGQIKVQYNGTAFIALNPVGLPTLLRNYIDGFILSTAGTSITMSIAAGQAADSTNTVLINGSALSKTTAAWAVGNAVGGKLSAAAIVNSTWYYFYEIRRPDTGVVDYGFDISSVAPTLPTNYTQYRYIGAGLIDGSGNWTKFTQTGDDFVWDTPVVDIVGAGVITARTLTCSIPRGRKMKGLFSVGGSDSTAQLVYISDLANSDLAPALTVTPLASAGMQVGGGTGVFGQASVYTNTNAQIRHRESTTNGVAIATIGWTDNRGKEL